MSDEPEVTAKAEPTPLTGSFVFPNGDTYRGQYCSGETGIKRHGKGKWVSKSGYEYDGEWDEDVIQGSGTMNLPDGSKYSGIFESGKYQGKGTLTWKDGSSYSGPFIQNKPSGDGIFTDGQNKQKWVGKFGPRGALQLRHLLQISPSDE
ncbi:unnamed protein product [Oikopleura dioica]|uniref:MORN repeat-containing protein 5 n=1 Tax=Oikopleura dioica TaxID=34765 RepID=E4Y7K2_OIKDI|nr:unnamed protein product [Oikopleura dioica]